MPPPSKPRRGATKAKVSPDRPNRPSFTTTSDAYAHDLYREAVGDEEVHAYLEDTEDYDNKGKRWSILDATNSGEDLLRSVFRIVTSIVRRFAKPTGDGVEREVVEVEMSEASASSSPAIAIRAAGPSFEIPRSQDSTLPSKGAVTTLGYSNMASYLSVKMDLEVGSAKENVDEMEAYARRIFRHQPNRYCVRSLVLTEKYARLVQFDRAGSQVTPLIDIHKDASTLIRLIAGLSSTAERVLGLDDSIQWTIVDGRKEKGTLTMKGPDDGAKTYRILERIPVPQDPIAGRATLCWRVQDPDALEELVVKDTWRPADRAGEHELLNSVKGIPGVVQMVSYEASRQQIKDFRCPTTTSQFYNRISTRISMKSYGKPIDFFTSMLQVICAIRDAIAAHRRLSGEELRILHRDISQNNVLLGREGAPEGERGILIDLDLAFQATDEQPKVKGDFNIGTRVFQSLSVLEGYSLKERTAEHDYLADLESFFFLLCYIFLTYMPDGRRLSSKAAGPSLVSSWGNHDAQQAFSLKRPIYAIGSDSIGAFQIVETNWGPVGLELFTNFRKWASKARVEKTKLVYKAAGRPTPNPLACVHARRDEHYAEVLAIFDQAINALQAEPSLPYAHGLQNHGATLSLPSQETPSVPQARACELLSSSPDRPTADEEVVNSVTPPVKASAAELTTPPSASPPLPTLPNLSGPPLKRPSEEGDHPDLPRTKARRIGENSDVSSHPR